MNDRLVKITIGLILILVVVFVGVRVTGSLITMLNIFDVGDNDMTKVKFETNYGDIVIEMFDNSPVTVGNFVGLVEKGTYDGVIFHRVIDDFMIQGGDPTGTGIGDANIPEIKDEYIEGNSNVRGTIAMANRGPDTGSSQFFINLVDNSFLDWNKAPLASKHPVFGKVVEGMDIVDKIAKVSVGAGDKPMKDVVIEKASVV